MRGCARVGLRWLLSVVVVTLGYGLALASSAPNITIAVDASDAPRKIIHAQLNIPASTGSLTL